MPTDMEEIYTIYTNALSTAQELTQKEAKDLSYQKLQEAESCLAILQIFRKYAALQLGKDVLDEHKQEYLQRLQTANETSQENISALEEEIRRVTKNLAYNYQKINENAAIRDNREENNRKSRNKAKMAIRRLAIKVKELKKEYDELVKAKGEQKTIQTQNYNVLQKLQQADQDTSEFFDFILKNSTELNTLVAQYAEKSLRELPNIWRTILYPRLGNNVPQLIKSGIDNRQQIDLELLDFMILYLEHPEMRKQIEELEKYANRNNRMKYIEGKINGVANRIQLSFFGTEKFSNRRDADVVPFYRIDSEFGDCFPRNFGYYAGYNLSIPDLIRDQYSIPKYDNIDVYQEFYRKLSVDLTFKITEDLLSWWKYINEHINGKISYDKYDVIAIMNGHPPRYIKPKDKKETNFLPNIYLHKDYMEIYSKFSDRLAEMKNILEDNDISVHNSMGDYLTVENLPKDYTDKIENNPDNYARFISCLRGLIDDINGFQSTNPELAEDLKRMYEPLLNMVNVGELYSLQDDVDYPEEKGGEQFSPEYARKRLNEQIIRVYCGFHMDTLSGLLILYRKFLELTCSLEGIEEKNIKDNIEKKYGMIPPLPSSYISKIAYYYTGHRQISFDMTSKGQRLSQHDINEHNEWQEAYKKLCTIQKLTRFISEREKGPVNLSADFILELEQDLKGLMNNSVTPVSKIH